MAKAHHAHKSERERQYGAIGLLGGSVVIAGILLKLGVGYLALALPAVLMATPVAANVLNALLNRIQGEAKEEEKKSSS